jgi:uncharacterized surface protein with fasciclin (FAS1) repeats
MKLNVFKQFILCVTILVGTASFAQTKMVGGSKMYPSKNIVENAIESNDHTTLVAAVKKAGLAETLQGDGPFTVFAPTNQAFKKLPNGAVKNLLKDENKKMLQDVLKYHVVSGKVTAKNLMNAIESNDGKYSFKALNGAKLTAMKKNGNVMIKDKAGNMAKVTTADVMQSNGIIHVIDNVLMTK